jgi:hypothetical protein
MKHRIQKASKGQERGKRDARERQERGKREAKGAFAHVPTAMDTPLNRLWYLVANASLAVSR